MKVKDKRFTITEPLKLTVSNDSVLGKNTKVYFNDQDMSKYITRMFIDLDVDGLVYVDITFLVKDGFEINAEKAQISGNLIIYEKDTTLDRLWKRIKNIFG